MNPKYNVWWCGARVPPQAARAASCAGATAARTRHLCDLGIGGQARRAGAVRRCVRAASLGARPVYLHSFLVNLRINIAQP